MIIFSTAKINLGLFILNKRDDGYHSIASLKYPIPVSDVIEILPSTVFKLQILGRKIDGEIEQNLIWKAFDLIKKRHNIPNVEIILQKTIPMGAGLGGGSSNASFVLKGLNTFFDLQLSDDTLRSYASELGSDCPFFIANSPQIATGKGDVLAPFDFSLKGKFLYLISPKIHIGTAIAYSGVKPKELEFDWEELKKMDFSYWRKALKNDFEESIFSKYPALLVLKQNLYEIGAVYASMSGSGSSLFGIFEKMPKMIEENNAFHRIYAL